MTPSLNRKPLIIAAAVVVLAFIGFASLMGIKRTEGSLQEGSVPNPQSSSQPDTKATPSASTAPIATPTPAAPDRPTFSGIDALVTRGLSAGQAENVKNAYYAYIVNSKQSINTVSIATDTLKKDPHSPSSPSSVYTLRFTTNFSNDSITDSQLDYADFTTIRLRLFNPVTKALLYDSGNLISQ